MQRGARVSYARSARVQIINGTQAPLHISNPDLIDDRVSRKLLARSAQPCFPLSAMFSMGTHSIQDSSCRDIVNTSINSALLSEQSTLLTWNWHLVNSFCLPLNIR